MSILLAGVHLFIGAVYVSVGLMTLSDLRRGWSESGMSHFGLAWLALCFTCGPHHLEHGSHLLASVQPVTALDLTTSLVGLPPGLIWFLLRIEKLRGGPGDRVIAGTTNWIQMLPLVASSYLLLMMTLAAGQWAGVARFDARLLPNVALVVLYTAVGIVLARTQVTNHRASGNWSLSGLSLTLVFPTCALMHMIWIVFASTGIYEIEGHLLVVDIISVPGAAYFLWVVWSLMRGSMLDWTATQDVEIAAEARPVVVDVSVAPDIQGEFDSILDAGGQRRIAVRTGDRDTDG